MWRAHSALLTSFVVFSSEYPSPTSGKYLEQFTRVQCHQEKHHSKKAQEGQNMAFS